MMKNEEEVSFFVLTSRSNILLSVSSKFKTLIDLNSSILLHSYLSQPLVIFTHYADLEK